MNNNKWINYLGIWTLILTLGCGGSSAPDETIIEPDNLDPNPLAVASLVLQTGADSELTIRGDTLYVTGVGTNSAIVDVSSPSTLQQVSSIQSGLFRVSIENNLLYATTFSEIFVYDIEEPKEPVFLTNLTNFGMPRGILAYRNKLYTGTNISNPLSIYDVTDPLTSQLLGSYQTGSSNADLLVEGNTLYLADFTHFRILNVSNPNDIQPIFEGNLPSEETSIAWRILKRDNFVFISGSDFHIFDITIPSEPELVLFIDTVSESQISMVINDDRLYMGEDDRVVIYDISNIRTPVELARIKTSNLISDIAYKDNHIYSIMSDRSCPAVVGAPCPKAYRGIEVYDVSQY